MSDQRLLDQLEEQFPWLKTADTENGEYEQVSGADTVQALNDWHAKLTAEGLDAPKGEREHARFGDFIKVARELYGIEGECEIDDNATISVVEGEGAYVAAWVHVGADNFCRTCHEPYMSAGAFFDGECRTCADKTEAKQLEQEENAGTDTDSKS